MTKEVIKHTYVHIYTISTTIWMNIVLIIIHSVCHTGIYNKYMQVHTICITHVNQSLGTTDGHKLFNAEHAIIILSILGCCRSPSFLGLTNSIGKQLIKIEYCWQVAPITHSLFALFCHHVSHYQFELLDCWNYKNQL